MERKTLYYGGCLAALQKLGVIVLLLGLAALGGWWFEGRDKYADSGVPVREPAKGDTVPTPMVPEPEDGAGLKEIEYDLQKMVVEAAGVSSPTTVKCDVPEIPSQPRTFGCTVHYMGLQVPIQIDITDVCPVGIARGFHPRWKRVRIPESGLRTGTGRARAARPCHHAGTLRP